MVFLITLNVPNPSLVFTMELPMDNKISFIGIEMVKNITKIETQAYRKSLACTYTTVTAITAIKTLY